MTFSDRSVSRRTVLKGTAAASAMAGLAWRTNLSALAQDATPAAVSGGTLRMGMQGDPSAFDFQTNSLTAIWKVVEHIYDGLTRIEPDLTVAPMLAESWDISEDGLVYTFHLRQATWSDGSAFSADDVAFTFTRLLDPVTAALQASELLSIKGAFAFNTSMTPPAGTPEASPVAGLYDETKAALGIKVIDAQTIEITLEAPDSSFLTSMGSQSTLIMSKAFVAANNNDVTQVTLGTGPYVLKEYVPNTSLKLERNAAYWDTGRPYFDAIDMIIASDDTARTGLIIQGSADFIEYAPLRDMDTLEATEGLKVAGDANTNIRFLGFNLTREPFTNVKVRQAIAMAIDRAPIIEACVFGRGTAVVDIFPPSFWAALDSPLPTPDIEGAKALLAEAGYADGFKTSITSWSEYSFLSNAATVIQEQLKQIGIEADLNLIDNGTMIAQVYGSHDFDLTVTGTSAYVDPHGLFLNNFASTSGGNFVSYNNPEVDSLIAQGISVTDTEARAEIYRQIQTILLADQPWTNLFVANQYEVMKDNVFGYKHVATGSNLFLRESWFG
ncbi:MAG TPA: ABC transporter substrate-binding protein [Thermomicrobiales bacterium]|nr:ABC transporter substrate-binding protein [Thermomicrobiales bacterium]